MQEPDRNRNIRQSRVKRTKSTKLPWFVVGLSVLLIPIALLIQLFEAVYALAILVAVFGLSIAGFKIYQGQYGWSTIAWAVGSLCILLLHFVIAPLVLRNAKKKKLGI